MSESESTHDRAADAFAQAVRERYDDVVRELVVFGSTARSETRGIDSDVDVFVVVDEEGEDVVPALRNLAYDVSLDYSVVVSVHALNADRFSERSNHPFVKRAMDEGRSYV